MDEDAVLEFLERLEREHDCIVPQNFKISDIDGPEFPPEGGIRLFVILQRKGNGTVSYPIDVSSENANEMMQRLRDGISTIC